MHCLSLWRTTSRIAVVFSMVSGAGISQSGNIFTLAGTGDYGYSGDRGSAIEARLDMSVALAADARGNIYLADCWNHVVRRITPDGTITTLAGSGAAGSTGDNGPAVSARLNCPRGLALDTAGNLYISDSANHRVRRVGTNGTITTFVGSGVAGFAGDGGRASAARVNGPRGLAVDTVGNLYIADSWNFRIRKVDAQGIITTIAGNGTYGVPTSAESAVGAPLGFIHGITVRLQDLCFTDVYNHRVFLLSPEGLIFRLSDAGFGSAGDGGPSFEAQFRFPRGIAATASGELYVVDSGNHRVRWIGNDFSITTTVGTGVAGFGGDGEAASAAQLNNPYDVAILPSGSLLISDLRNYRLRSADAGVPQNTKPEITTQTGLINAASKHPGVSPGALVAIDGRKLAQGAASANVRDLPTALAGTTLFIDNTPAKLVTVSMSQIRAVLPDKLQPGMHSLRVAVTGNGSQSLPFHVEDAAPGLFGDESGRAEVYHPDNSRNSEENPASRGTQITFRATGVQNNIEDCEMLVGGRKATVSAVRPTGSPGQWDVEVMVPADAVPEPLTPAMLVWRGRGSNTVTVSLK